MKAYANDHCLIDTIDANGITHIRRETFEEVLARHPDAKLVDVEEWCAERRSKQLGPVTWNESTEEQYWEMLECLPPARMSGGAFLVGEPIDHIAGTGEPTFEMYRKVGDKFFVSSRPVTSREFSELITREIA